MKKINLLSFLIILIALSSQPALSQVLQQAAFQFNGKGDFTDKYEAVAIDNADNMYVAGWTVNANQNHDILLQKVSTTSNLPLWTKTVNGSSNNVDEANAVLIDAANNVYVLGFQTNLNTGKDIITQKYNSAGSLLWTAVYNHTSNLDDVPVAFSLDNNGKLLILGTSVSATKKDFVLIQYSTTDGMQQWAQRWNNVVANNNDEAVALVVNSANEALIIGTSSNIIDTDIVMAKYSTTGSFLWSQTIDKGGNDQAVCLKKDAADNLYLAGNIYQNNEWNVLVTKYNDGGFLEWEQIFDYIQDDIAVGIGLDANNNAYVTTKSDVVPNTTVSYDAVVTKWDASGNQIWIQTWDNPANGTDIPMAMVVNASGEVVVTGKTNSVTAQSDVFTFKLSTSGSLVWEDVYQGANMTNDAGAALVLQANQTIVAGYLGDAQDQADGMLLKYTNIGGLQYIFTYNGKGDNNDRVKDVAYLASSPQIYLTGSTARSDGNKDICVMRMNTATNAPVWTAFTSGRTSAGEDEGVAITFDTQKDVYVAGNSQNAQGNQDIILAKYKSATGDTLWTRYYNGGDMYDEAVEVIVDAVNNVFVAGTTQNPTKLNDFVVLKYDISGNLVGSATFNGTGNTNDKLVKMRSGSDFLYVVGESKNPTTSLRNIVLIKYDKSLNVIWQKTYGIAADDELVNDLYIDSQDNPHFTGAHFNGTDWDYMTVKYDNTGVQKWVKYYNGAAAGDDEAIGIVIDASGNVTVTGKSDRDATADVNFDIRTVQYNASGSLNWTKFFNGNMNLEDVPTGMTIDEANNIYVMGYSNSGTATTPNLDFALLRYKSDSTLQWQDNVVVSDSIDIPTAMYARNSQLFVAGDVWANAAQTDIYLLRYEFTGVLAEVDGSTTQNAVVYPNPFEDKFMVRLENTQPAEIYVFNQLGQAMNVVVNSQGNEHEVLAENLPHGVYFYQVKQANQLVATGKLIK